MKKPSPELKDILNPEEAVRYFGFSRRKFFGMLREGKFKKYTALYGRRISCIAGGWNQQTSSRWLRYPAYH